MRRLTLIAAGVGLMASTAAHAEMAPQLRSMLDAAIASGNEAEIDTVVKYLKAANPADAAEADQIIASHRAQIAAAKEEKLRNQGLLDGWSGEGQIGASHSSGNTNSTGLSAGIALTKEGLRWRHGIRALADYERTDGETSRNQILAAYEPNYKFNDRLFAYGLAQYERDRFAGFSSRMTLSGGLGYRVIAEPTLTVDVKAGPAWRKTNYIGEPTDSELAGMGALNAKWDIAPTVTLSEDAAILIGSGNTNLTSLTALTAKLHGALSARVSYQVTHNSNPPFGFKKTDTLSRFSLVYGF